MSSTYLTSEDLAGAEESQFAGATQMGPVHPVDASDLWDASAAPNGQRYTQAPREREAWQFAVDQAGPVMSQLTGMAAAHTAAVGPFDGPYDTATTQPGVPLYGMAGGGS